MKRYMLLLLLSAAAILPAAAIAPATAPADSLTTSSYLTPRGEIVPVFKTGDGKFYVIRLLRSGQMNRYYIQL